MMFVCATYAEGAPSLGSLQGRVAMLPTRLLSFCTSPRGMRSWFPPFAKCAKDGAPSVLFVPANSKAGATRRGVGV
jgi:hypothetical protein